MVTPPVLSGTNIVQSWFDFVRFDSTCIHQPKQCFSLQIGFLAIRGNGYSGDIALDDVEVTSGFCEPGHGMH